MVGVKYIGCELDSGEIKLQLFDDENVRDDQTIKSLQNYLKKRRRDVYGDDHFIIKRGGLKYETDNSRAAKSDFHNFSDMLIQELTIENFEDSISLMDEMFHEAIDNCYLLSGN